MPKDHGDGEREPLRKARYDMRKSDTGKGGSKAALPDIHLWTSRPTRRCGVVIVQYQRQPLSISRRSKSEAALGHPAGVRAKYSPAGGSGALCCPMVEAKKRPASPGPGFPPSNASPLRFSDCNLQQHAGLQSGGMCRPFDFPQHGLARSVASRTCVGLVTPSRTRSLLKI